MWVKAACHTQKQIPSKKLFRVPKIEIEECLNHNIIECLGSAHIEFWMWLCLILEFLLRHMMIEMKIGIKAVVCCAWSQTSKRKGEME